MTSCGPLPARRARRGRDGDPHLLARIARKADEERVDEVGNQLAQIVRGGPGLGRALEHRLAVGDALDVEIEEARVDGPHVEIAAEKEGVVPADSITAAPARMRPEA